MSSTWIKANWHCWHQNCYMTCDTGTTVKIRRLNTGVQSHLESQFDYRRSRKERWHCMCENHHWSWIKQRDEKPAWMWFSIFKCLFVCGHTEYFRGNLGHPLWWQVSIGGRSVAELPRITVYVWHCRDNSFVLKLGTGNQLQLLLPGDISLLSWIYIQSFSVTSPSS